MVFIDPVSRNFEHRIFDSRVFGAGFIFLLKHIVFSYRVELLRETEAIAELYPE